jgi:predicted metal-binding membrane protein
MSIAMMAPTIIPTLITYEDILQVGGRKKNSFWAFIFGFMSIWFVFSLIGSICQNLLARSYLLDETGALLSTRVSAIFLLVAGLYQLSPLKDACLKKCRRPFTFFMQNWKDGLSGSFSMGINLGVFCLGCCWALMALAFVGGTMNLAFMVLMTFLMILEKLPDFGKFITKPISLILIASATVLVWF